MSNIKQTTSSKGFFNIEQAAVFLGVNKGTIILWAKKGMLEGTTTGPQMRWRFSEVDLAKLIAKPNLEHKQKKFLKIKKILIDNADAIQKIATIEHAKLIGADPVPAEKFRKYREVHVKIIKAFGRYLDNSQKGITFFSNLGVELAKQGVEDGLSIEEVVNGSMFMEQAIWKKIEQTGLLKEITSLDLYEFSQTIRSFCNTLSSKTAFTYHDYYVKEVARSEDKFRALTERGTDAIALVNPKGKVIYASMTTEQLMGYKPEELKKLTNPFELVPPDDRSNITKVFEKLLKEPGTSVSVTYRVLHKNGKQIWIESVMTNLLNDPNVSAVVLNYRDISERKMLETQKDDFISIATHELKTPVTSIKGYAQVLQSRFAKEGNMPAVEMLSKMDTQLNKLTLLIRDLLDVTLVNGGKLHFNEGVFDFSELAKEIIDEMQLTTTRHHISKNLKTTKMMHGDRDRIGQIITNLLSNAIKYSPQSKQIHVTISENKKEVTLCVSDTGIGVPKDKQEKVFDRFFRVGDAEDTFAGLGLGLFISSEIVKRHGGRIWVKSKVGKGSTFCFSLPIKVHPQLSYDLNLFTKEE